MTAILLVYTGVLLLGLGRDQMQGLADDVLARASQLLIAGVGLWLVLRGLRALWSVRDAGPHAAPSPAEGLHLEAMMLPAHDHPTGGEICPTCGHAHGPTLQQVENTRSLRDALVVIASVAVRPCTGALFLLILTWRMGIDWAGIIGALVMGLGTATTTGLVAAGSVVMRESTLAQVASAPATARSMAFLAILAGAIVMIVSLQIFFAMP
jgi:ABC-type nickel/cobalt efflux system permease component RcnA